MPQKTNLNITPYYDDYNPDKDFHKVLFKPGTPVQARELTGLQSMMQNQIEKFGEHMFKEGAKVIPGQISYIDNFAGICIEENFRGIPVSLYSNELVGSRIKGERSGVEVRIELVLGSEGSDRGITTLYYSTLKSGTDQAGSNFEDGENLILLNSISYGETETDNPLVVGSNTIAANAPFAVAISTGANVSGSAANIQEGVYFLRGNFVRVAPQTILIEQYNPMPTARVGLLVEEEIITAAEDPDLNDNAQGWSNYSAPGADRLKISTTLVSRNLLDTQDTNFVELMRIKDGDLETFVKNTDYNFIKSEFARRTYDESGDYYIKNFEVDIKETLNNLEGNSGLYNPGDATYQGNTPSDDLMEYIMSPGKAYIRGFEIDKQTDTVIDVEKPRTTREVELQSIPIAVGPKIAVNTVHGAPIVGFNTTLTASLRDSTVGVASTSAAGTAIGACRIYDFNLESQTYTDDASEYTLRLFDIAPYTRIEITQPFTTLRAGAYLEGQYSGASGYVADTASGLSTFSMHQVKGQFHKGEKLSVDGIKYNTTVAITTNYELSNVKSIYQGTTTGISTFNANLVLSTKHGFENPLTITARGGSVGVSTITAPKGTFVGIITTNDLVRFTSSDTSDPAVLKVDSIGIAGTSVVLSGIQTVTNVYDGAPPTTGQTLSDFEVVSGDLINVEDNTLYTTLDNRNIDSVDLTGANIIIRRTFETVSVAQNALTLATAGANEFYQAFDEETYNVAYQDGTVQSLSEDMFDFTSNNKVVSITGLDRATETNVRVSSTLLKNIVVEKKKQLQKVSSIVIDRSSNSASGIGSTSLGDGLTYSNVYGTRVQDREISLNMPDVLKVVGIFESDDGNNPTLPTVTLTAISGPAQTTADFILGERLVGESSKAVALLLSVVNSQKIEVVYLNERRFAVNELISADESGVTASPTNVGIADKEVTGNYLVDDGQRKSFYDYGRVIRKKGSPIPKRRLRIVYQNFTIPTSDTGDLFTSESYADKLYSKIPAFEGVRNSDIIDIRPRVGTYSTASTYSPFDINSRSFNSTGQAVSNVLVSDNNILLTYEYYLGRTDKIFLDSFGKFNVVKGVPSENPQLPADIDGSMAVATIKLPPYLFKTSEAQIQRVEHKRYRMRDISDLDTRITNLEFYTALSLLEKETESLTIQDAKGLDRFKAGFFVDSFKGHLLQDQTNEDFQCSIDTFNGELRPAHFTTALDLIPATNSIPGIGTDTTADERFNLDLIDPNLRRTGDAVTLDYDEMSYIQNLQASRVESVNPFLVSTWMGTLTCFPSSEIWVDKKVIKTNEYDTQGPDFIASVQKIGIGEATGFGEIEWGSWVDTVVGRETRTNDTTNTSSTSKRLNSTDDVKTTTTKVVRTTSDVEVRNQIRRGSAIRNTTPHVETKLVGSRVVNRDVITFMRSRNIELRGTRLKPGTRVYPIVDNTNLQEYMTPKLLEIQMVNGTFEKGETIVGEMVQSTPTLDTVISPESATLKFRLAAANHRTGPYDSPIKRYPVNPYDTTQVLPDSYSSASTILNIDTASLASTTNGGFFGYARKGMVLRGLTSNAQATISEVRLVTDDIGWAIATIFIPDPSQPSVPTFTTGNKIVKLSSLPNITFLSSLNSTGAETVFAAHGVLEFTEEDILSTRIAGIHKVVFTDNRSTESILGSSQSIVSEKTEDTILRNVRQQPQRGNCDARYVAYTVAINNGFGSYTGYHNSTPQRQKNLYNTSWLLQQPGAPIECGADPRTGGRGRQGRGYRRARNRRPKPGSGTPGARGRTWNYDNMGRLIPTAKLGTIRTAYTRQTNRSNRRSGGGRGGNRARRGGGSGGRGGSFDGGKWGTFSSSAAYWQARSNANNAARGGGRGGRGGSRGRGGGGRRGCSGQRDPLAQSFYINQAEGVFITSIDVYFQSKDEVLPVTAQIRTMRDGIPTTTVIPFSEVDLQPNEVEVSDDASIATKFRFQAPVYLQGNHEYAVVLLADTPLYGAWISRMGDEDITNSRGGWDFSRYGLSGLGMKDIVAAQAQGYTDADLLRLRDEAVRKGLNVGVGARKYLAEVENKIDTADAPRGLISQQPLLGSLFKSQNGSTWDASQFEDLKFVLNRAQFTTFTEANLSLYNPSLELGNDGITQLGENPIETISQKTVVGLGSTLSSSQASTITAGVRISQQNNTTANGVVINTRGAIGIGASVDIINAGIGYTPSSGFSTYSANLTTLSGSGSGAVASITINAGSITSCFVTNGGTGYAIGDEVGVTTLGNSSLGRNGRFSVGILSAINAIELDEVQGVFNTGVAATLTYINQSSGATTNLTGIYPDALTADSDADGLHFDVTHRNYGMYHGSNVVSISNIKSDTIPTTITANVDKDVTDNISLASTAHLTVFENVGVGTTNAGYVLMNGEIISYTGVNGTQLTGITRNIDNTGSFTHNSGDYLSKYELNGVSLRRINKNHTLGDATVSTPRTLDTYQLKVDMSTNGIDRSVNTSFPKLAFNSSKRSGGSSVIATKNIQFETLTPNVQTLVVADTRLNSSVRTVSLTSVNGTETPFEDQGYESIELNKPNNLSSPRGILSQVNETALLTTLPGNKSFTLDLQLYSENSFVSPFIDLDRVNMILTSNRLNEPISNWVENQGIMITGEDPHSAVYVTKKIELSNPANSIKVMLGAYRHQSADIRILYKIFPDDSSIDETPYNLFPGYANIDDLGNVIKTQDNNGTSNTLVIPSKPGEFRDYEWFVDDLPEFQAFAIKIVMTGTNQAEPPRIRDLKAIAVR